MTRDYDTWRLSGPEEPDEPQMETCPECDGSAMITERFSARRCETCNGTGEVVADADDER